MARLDVFKADAFSMESLLAAIENVDYKEQFLGSLSIFDPKPQITRAVSVEMRDNELAIIQTTPDGAPPATRGADKAKVRLFNTVRLAKSSTIKASELAGIREFGTENELKQVQAEVARRMTQITNDMELTWEFHRLGAVQGILLDADGSEIVNYFDAFDVAQPSAVTIDFDTLTAGQVRPLIEKYITRPLIRACKGAFVTGSSIVALCGDDFWDKLVNHAEVRQTYLNQAEAASLREGTAFGTFRYAGVTWVNYRGTDDGSTVAVASEEAKFFPVGAPGVFQVAWGPSEFMPGVNRPGVPLLPMIVPDPSGREAFVDVEGYSYPLYLCTKPLALRSAALPT